MVKKYIETFNLGKKYPSKNKNKFITALENVNLSVNKGEIFGLLGPNGAGKTTLIQILTTLIRPTSGYAIIDGYHLLKRPGKVKSKVALMLGSDMLYYRITAYDNLKFFCKLYEVNNYKHKINKMVKLLGIERWLDEYVSRLSSGTKIKLALARTLLVEREILFLDEPTLGLDVKTISLFIDIIKNSNKTIILTSHDLNVVEKLCDRIAFINEGKILDIGTQDEVRSLIKTEIKIEITITNGKQELFSELKNYNFIADITQQGKNIILINLEERAYYKNLFKLLGNYNIIKIKEIETTLEDLFLRTY